MEERDLDFYVSTPDEHFNENAQGFYFRFSGSNKPVTDKPFIDFIDVLYEAYFFAINNPSKPFGCVAKIKELARLKGFNESDLLIFVDLLLGIITNMSDVDPIQKVYIQIVDFRHDLSPLTEDPDILNSMNRVLPFDIDKIKEVLAGMANPSEKLIYLSNTYFDFKSKQFEIDEFELGYYESIGLLHFIKVELERAQFEVKVKRALKTGRSKISTNEYRLTSKRKTDFIKILSAMYDAKMFVGEDGAPVTNKQKLMDAFGAFLGDDFTAYSASLSQAKTRDEKTFLKPFKEIEKEALRYFEEVGE